MSLYETPTRSGCKLAPAPLVHYGQADLNRTPFMLDAYEAEYEEQRRDKEKHAHELDQLRNANRSLSTQVYVDLGLTPYHHLELIK